MQINRAVYRLWHDGSERGRVGYIGKDKYYPHRTYLKSRAKEHNSPVLYKALNKYNLNLWKIEVLQFGFDSDEELSKAEIFWIAKLNSKDAGYNCSDGGEGGLNPSLETRKKIGSAHKGKIVSEQTRTKMREAALGRKHSSDTINKIAAAKNFLGHKHSEETKQKIATALTGRNCPPRSPEQCQAIRERVKGNKHKLGWKCPEEVKKKIGDAQRGDKNHAFGKKFSAEHRAKLVEALHRRWQKVRERTDINAANPTINISIPGPACPDSATSTI